MSLFGRLTLLGRGLWKTKTQNEPDFSAELEKELEHVTTEEERTRAKARLARLKGGEEAAIESAQDGQDDDQGAEPEAPAPSIDNPPKKTL